jgi:hypothetical protein
MSSTKRNCMCEYEGPSRWSTVYYEIPFSLFELDGPIGSQRGWMCGCKNRRGASRTLYRLEHCLVTDDFKLSLCPSRG